VLWELILFWRFFVICVEQENKKASWTQEKRGNVQEVFVKLAKVVLLLHSEMRLVSFGIFFLGLDFFRLADANFL